MPGARGMITGLTAAWEAALSGASVTLVEAGPVLGGKLRTEHVDGLLVEGSPGALGAMWPTSGVPVGVAGALWVGSELEGRAVAVWAGAIDGRYISAKLQEFPDVGANKDLMTAAIRKAGTISPAHDGRVTLVWD